MSDVTLALDAATYTGTIAVLRGRELLAAQAVAMRGVDEERLMPAVAATLEKAGVAVAALDRIACGEGPGSFTSLRIAASIAKGIAVARGIPLLPVSSLALTVASTREPLEAGRYVAALDALRHESYVADCTVDEQGFVRSVTAPRVVPNGEVLDLEAGGVRVVGPGRSIDALPHARGLARLALSLGEADLDAWEPVYGRLAEAQVKWEAAHGRPLGRA